MTITDGGALSAGNVSIGDLTVDGTSALGGSVSIGGGYGNSGVTITDTGRISADGTSTLAGTVSIGGGFGSSGMTFTDTGKISADDDMLVTGDKRFLGNVTVDGNLDVRGLSNLDGTVFIGGGYKQHDATGGTSSKGTTITDAGIISASGTATIAGSVSIGGGMGQSGTTITDAGRISTDGTVEIGGGYAGVGNGDTGPIALMFSFPNKRIPKY